MSMRPWTYGFDSASELVSYCAVCTDPTLWATGQTMVWAIHWSPNQFARREPSDLPWWRQNWWKVYGKQFCRTGASQFRKSDSTNLAVGGRHQCSHFLLAPCNNYFRHKTNCTALFPHTPFLPKATGSYRTYPSLVKLQPSAWVCRERPVRGQNTLMLTSFLLLHMRILVWLVMPSLNAIGTYFLDKPHNNKWLNNYFRKVMRNMDSYFEGREKVASIWE